ncbi:MAG: FtsX-like permease family protein [Thermofilum sp.]
MKAADYIYLATTSLIEKRGRAIGAVIGVMIAVIALSMALGIGESFQREFVEQLQRTVAANSIIVVGGAAGLTDIDIMYFKGVAGVRDAFGIAMAQGTIFTADGEKAVQIVAVDPAVLPLYLGVGDMSKAVEEGESEPRGMGVLVSHDLWADPGTGRKLLDIGSTLTIRLRGRSLQLIAVGLLKQIGSSGGMGQATFAAPSIYMSPDTFFAYVSPSRSYSAALVLVEDLSKLEEVTADIRAVSPPGSRVISAAAIVQQFVSLVGALQLFVGLISAVGMGVTALWILDSTAISVIQRTKEIGILKALGYTGVDVLLLFVLEATVVSAIGVAAGLAVSLALSLAVKISAFGFEISPVLTPQTVAAAALLPLLANAIAAYVPSRRAAQLNPVEALRYE